MYLINDNITDITIILPLNNIHSRLLCVIYLQIVDMKVEPTGVVCVQFTNKQFNEAIQVIVVNEAVAMFI